MRARWLCLPAVLVSLAGPSRSALAQDDVSKFQNRETAIWESVKARQIDAIRKVTARDYVAVYDNGIVDRATELDMIAGVTLRSFSLANFAVRRPDGMTAIVTYKATVEGEAGGQSMSGTYNVLTVWRRSGNAWALQAHSEVKAK